MTAPQPCVQLTGPGNRRCGNTPTRRYIQGHHCADHGAPAPHVAPRTQAGQRHQQQLTATSAVLFIAEWNAAVYRRAGLNTPQRREAT